MTNFFDGITSFIVIFPRENVTGNVTGTGKK
jgi:hypothetical protein